MTDNERTPMPEAELAPSRKEEQERQARIRDLNDHLRKHAHGGLWRVTAGIAGLPPETARQVLKAVAAFSDFNSDNDPWGEHDCAVIEVAGERIIWKIDYYDRSQRYHNGVTASEIGSRWRWKGLFRRTWWSAQVLHQRVVCDYQLLSADGFSALMSCVGNVVVRS